MVRQILGLLAISLSACTFTPEAGQPLAAGIDCTRDGQCQTGICGITAPGKCVECRADLGCASGQRCDLGMGRCVAPAATLEHQPNLGAHRRTNDLGRVHVGHVAVVPVTTEVSR